MSKALIQPSFAAGELSPSLHARVDLAKYHVGAAVMRNFFVDYRGGAPTRGGYKFVGKCKQSFGTPPRAISFQFSQTQTYVLEFGGQYIRFITNGGYILETPKVITNVTQAIVSGVVTSVGHGFANGDWVYITGVVGMTELNGRTFVVADVTANTFTLVDIWGDPVDTHAYGAYVSGGTAARYYTIVSPYAAADLPKLKFTQSADVMTFVHPNYPIYKLTRAGQTNWSITSQSFATTQAAPVAVSAVANTVGTATALFSYVVTAVNALTGEESIASNIVSVSSVDIAQTAGSITITWNAAAGAGSYNVYKAPIGFNATTTPVGTLFGIMATTIGLQAVDGNILPDFTKTPPIHKNPFAPRQILAVNPTAVGSGYAAGTTASITDPNGTGAVIQPIVIGGTIQGYIVINGGTGYTAPTLSLGATGGGTGATASFSVGSNTGIYPSCTAYFQQRQYYANALNAPDTFWASKPGQFNNMDISVPVQDSDAITDTISAQQVNGIQAMVPMPQGLVVLTGLGAWQLTGGGGNTAVTPNSADAAAQAYNGCSPTVPPLTINYDILYVQEKGSIVRDLAYNFFTNIYTGTDLTILSNHLFTGYQLLEWAWCEEPYKMAWAVRDDGIMLSLTYLKEQEVYAWARHDTFGLFKSVCSVSEQPVNAQYAIVQRRINGQWVYYMERQDNRLWNTVEDTWAVDSGLQTVPVKPNAILTVTDSTGFAVAQTDAPVFDSSMVGKVIRAGGGIMTIATFFTSQYVVVDITQSITDTIPNDALARPVPFAAGDWGLWTPITVVSGLEHLKNETVAILADGSVQTPRVVAGNSITLDPQPVTLVTSGLGFQAQLQSLDVDAGNPTIQGRRKNIPQLTVRVVDTRGLKAGRYFDTVTEIKERGNSIYAGTAIPLYTGDRQMTLDSAWDVPGQICLQQDYPLPATVLGIIPEINVGDPDG